MNPEPPSIASSEPLGSGHFFVTGCLLLTIAAALLLLTQLGMAAAQSTHPAHIGPSPMQQHYEAAFNFQSAGNLASANAEYRLFLAMALHAMANGDANLGDYAHAAPLYEQTLVFAPDDLTLEMDYARAARDASDWRKAKALSASFLDATAAKGQPPDLRAVYVLAHALLELGEHQQALAEFKTACGLKPGVDTSIELASAYLMIGDLPNGKKILDEILTKSGDSAEMHMKIGIIYGNAQFYDAANEEFQKALAKNPRILGAHYSLGASYLMQLGEPGFDKAQSEFMKETALDPTNTLVYVPLARIALAKHRYAEAEADMKHAIDLKQRSTATYLLLAQLYRETGKVPQEETALRKAIEVNLGPAKNNYEVQQAHYFLGRLLIQAGNVAEGHKELDISRNLLFLKEQLLQTRLAGSIAYQAPLERTHEPDPADQAAEKAFEKQIEGPISSSYDNLGVNAANAHDFAAAATYFQQAAQWKPDMDNIDNNWGRAALAAKQYKQAEEPLKRTLAQRPENNEVRSMLGFCLFMTHNYAESLRVLQPIESSLQSDPVMGTIYAGSSAMSGDSAQGIARLKVIEQASPQTPLVHSVLGEAYAKEKDYSHSADELHTALSLDPGSADAKKALALTDVALGQKAEALQLLSELAGAGSTDGEVYSRLAGLQIESGSTKAAVGNLETAVRLDPMNIEFHQQLAEAYRKNNQPDDADRETRASEALSTPDEAHR
jgi:tetratricopeptide (TPR) repeat protein